MSIEYMRLESTPGLQHPGYPICEACEIEVDLDGEWICPSCGTSWPSDNLEHPPEMGELYEEWSGEKLTGITVPRDEAWKFSKIHPPKDREKRIAETYKAVEEMPQANIWRGKNE